MGLLEQHWPKLAAVEIHHRAGSAPKPTFFERWELPATMQFDGSEEVLSKLTGRKRSQAARELGQELWNVAVEHTDAHGPVLDWYLLCFGKKGDKPLGQVARRCDLSRGSSSWGADIDDPVAFQIAVLRELAGTNKDKDKLFLSLLERVSEPMAATADLQAQLVTMTRTAVDEQQHVLELFHTLRRAEIEAGNSQARFDACVQLARDGMSILGRDLVTAVETVFARRNEYDTPLPRDLRELSRELARSLTIAQTEELDQAFKRDLLDMLLSAAKAESEEASGAAWVSMEKELRAHMPGFRQNALPRQRLLLSAIRTRLTVLRLVEEAESFLG